MPPSRFTAVACDPAPCRLGEGPHWDAGRQELAWVDILSHRVWLARFDDGDLRPTGSFDAGSPVGAVLPWAGPAGGWLQAAGAGFSRLSGQGQIDLLAQPESFQAGAVRMNDAKCDPQGRCWAGSMAYDYRRRLGLGSLYSLDRGGEVRRVLSGLTVSNGLGWSPDGATMYVTDSAAGAVDAWDFDGAAGAIEHRRAVLRFPAGAESPDGLAVDDEGLLWVAIWGGGAVRRYDPSPGRTGPGAEPRPVAEVRLPVSQPTSCCFGGPDLATLFITSARDGLSDTDLAAQPDAGRLFACRPWVGGPAGQPFRGSWPMSRG